MTSEKQYFLKINWEIVDKEIKKFPRNIISIIKRDITMLEYNPESGTKLDSFKSATLYKKRFQEVEIYYTVEKIAVIVLGFVYLGTVNFNGIESGIKSGQHSGKTTTKQQRTINFYKNKFQKLYKN